MSEEKLCLNCMWWLPNRATLNRGNAKICLRMEMENREFTDVHDSFSCKQHVSATDTEVNVPNHCENGMSFMRNPNPVDGPTEILIVTYAKDLPWLDYTLKGIRRFCTGFQGVTVAHPSHENHIFAPLAQKFGVRLHSYNEVAGKGMLQHMVKMAEADIFLPPSTKYVLHMDADCIMRMPTTPEDYFLNDKPYYLIRTWSSLGYHDPRHPIAQSVSDCSQWKPATDFQLGWDTEWYTMCMNTAVMPREFYPAYRAHLENVHRKPFEAMMLEGENGFPQTRMDWTAMGAFAHKHMHDKFTWIDVEAGAYPEDRKKAYWSHGGLTSEIRMELDHMIR